jgi:hypothetical protein
MKSGNLNFLEPSGPLQACITGLPYLFTFTYTHNLEEFKFKIITTKIPIPFSIIYFTEQQTTVNVGLQAVDLKLNK